MIPSSMSFAVRVGNPAAVFARARSTQSATNASTVSTVRSRGTQMAPVARPTRFPSVESSRYASEKSG
ncbi:MAG: hypothetical protein K0R81_3405 [Microbacterium sp.]|nr:hypothetical protein [Microbacterium sp.]